MNNQIIVIITSEMFIYLWLEAISTKKNAAIAAVYCSFAYFLARYLLKKHEWQLEKGCDWKPYHK